MPDETKREMEELLNSIDQKNKTTKAGTKEKVAEKTGKNKETKDKKEEIKKNQKQGKTEITKKTETKEIEIQKKEKLPKKETEKEIITEKTAIGKTQKLPEKETGKITKAKTLQINTEELINHQENKAQRENELEKMIGLLEKDDELLKKDRLTEKVNKLVDETEKQLGDIRYTGEKPKKKKETIIDSIKKRWKK